MRRWQCVMMTLLFYVYVFLVPLEIYTELIPKGPEGINFANLSMLLLAAWLFMGRSTRGRPLLLPSPLNVPVTAMLISIYLGMVLTSLTLPGAPSAFDPLGEPFKRYLQFLNIFLLFFVAAGMIDSRRKIMGLLLVLCLVSLPAVRAFRSDLLSTMSWHYSDNMRVRGPFVWIGSNELGAFFVYGALFLGVFGMGVRNLPGKGVFFGAAALYCYGILYSFSRGTQLAFLAALSLVAFIRYRFTLVLLIVLMLASPLWLPTSVKERWLMTTDENGQLEESAQSRKEFAATAWNLFLTSPLVGHGVGSYQVLNPAAMDTHNHYMRTLSESGLVGMALLLMLWFGVLKISYGLWLRAVHPFDRQYGLCLLIATLGLMIANLFGDRFTHFAMIGQYWVLVGMGARLYANMTGAEALEQSGNEQAPAEDPQAAPEAAGAQPGPADAGPTDSRPAGGRLAAPPAHPQAQALHLSEGLREHFKALRTVSPPTGPAGGVKPAGGDPHRLQTVNPRRPGATAPAGSGLPPAGGARPLNLVGAKDLRVRLKLPDAPLPPRE